MTTAANSLALIADVHGNSWALDAVLADIDRRGVERAVNLGDSLDGPLDPAGTAARLRALGSRLALSLRGNGERLLLANLASTQPRQLYQDLDRETVEWLRVCPGTGQVDGLFCCHGTPGSDATYLLEEIRPDGTVCPVSGRTLAAALADVPGELIACAHSHLPRVMPLPDGRLVVNPGSVGLPAYDDDLPYPHAMSSGSPAARYAVLTRRDKTWSVEPAAVIYPWREAAAAARRNGRDDWAGWIETGRATVTAK